MRKRIDLTVEEKVWHHYKYLCAECGIVPSRRVERFMRKEIESLKKGKLPPI